MKKFLQHLASPLHKSPEPNIVLIYGGGKSEYFWWLLDCHGFVYNISLIIPSFVFVAFLATKARSSFKKLTYGRSYMMIAYYVLLWALCLLNLLWCFFQTMQCNSTKQTFWNILSLFTNSGMLFLEISLVAFLLQGNNTAVESDALKRTFTLSGTVAAVDMLLKAIFVFGFDVPLFDYDHETGHPFKWGFWIIHKLLLSAVYGFIVFMHHSKWKETLPARPAFYNYICAMFTLSLVSFLACLLGGNGSEHGFWLFDLATVCYHALYLPLLYITFLSEFFQEDDMRLENIYYSEMKDAGFFDSDWD